MSSAVVRKAPHAAQQERATPLAAAYARYANLIVRQLEAAHAEDLHTLDALADEREAAASEIDRLSNTLTAWCADTAAQLEACAELDRRLIERLTGMRTTAQAAVRALDGKRAGAAAYGGAAQLAAPALDLRL